MNFKQLGLSKKLLQSIRKEGYEEPTPIQEKAIPHVIEGKDVIAGAATGSGKTLAFGSAIISNCEPGEGLQAIVLTPTRELAKQVAEDIETYSEYKPFNVLAVYGGVAIGPQIHKLPKTDIVVGTPGRTLDLMSRGELDLSKIKVLVLDEADRMLDMGFIDDVERIMGQCPKDKQTLLFSATITPKLEHLSKKYMHNQVSISAEAFVDASKLRQVYYDVPGNLKLSLLVHLLKEEDADLIMVFCNTRRTVDFVAKNLKAQGIQAEGIHGGYSQAQRNRKLQMFKNNKKKVLVCTDVAARGLHIENVSHVYNYDVPNHSKKYIHRIGRTARAGEKGKAITLLAEDDHPNFRRIFRDFSVEIESIDRPYIDRIRIKT